MFEKKVVCEVMCRCGRVSTFSSMSLLLVFFCMILGQQFYFEDLEMERSKKNARLCLSH